MKRYTFRSARREQGLTLIELMIALVLGLFLVGGVIAVVVANSQAYRTNEGLSQVQESSRTAFELLARDLREAGATGCGNGVVTNVLNGGGGNWLNWTGVRGYQGGEAAPFATIGTGVAQRVNGTDAILVQRISGTGHNVVAHNTGVGGGAANFQINSPTTLINDGDILLVCDPTRAVVFQAQNYNSSNTTIVFNTGGSESPGNCSKYLNPPASAGACGGGTVNPPFGPNSQIMAPTGTFWYIGNNGRAAEGGRSLYRTTFGGATEEVVPGVTDMQLSFRDGTANTFGTAPGSWDNVTAVEVTLTTTSLDARVSTDPGVNDGRLQRSFTSIVGIRNRIQ